MWNTFVRNFAPAMSLREVADDSLEDCLYGLDIGENNVLLNVTLAVPTPTACLRRATLSTP